MDPLKNMENYLDELNRIKIWPSKKNNRLPLLKYLYDQFKRGYVYNEKEVNQLLKKLHTFEDPALLRREMVEIGYLSRLPDGSKYWVVDIDNIIEDLNKKYLEKENIY
jgi:hypothetical protein